jgi:hypothetical protein
VVVFGFFVRLSSEENLSPVEREIKLNINLQYPALDTYDSAFVIFRNSTLKIKQTLTLNNTTQTATGHIIITPPGDWEFSASFYSTLQTNHESFERNAVAGVSVTSTTTDLTADATVIVIKNKNILLQNLIVDRLLFLSIAL